MALKPAPEKSKEKKNSEKAIEEIVNKGGRVAEENKEEKEKWTMISVRLPEWMLKDIDKETSNRSGLSRNAWILESFQDKLS